jgi:hypothetical protein
MAAERIKAAYGVSLGVMPSSPLEHMPEAVHALSGVSAHRRDGAWLTIEGDHTVVVSARRLFPSALSQGSPACPQHPDASYQAMRRTLVAPAHWREQARRTATRSGCRWG